MPELTDTQQDTHVSPSPMPPMELATGFWASKTPGAAPELDLFSSRSGDRGTTAPEPAEREGISELAEDYLVRGRPYHVGGFVQMLDQRLYAGWGRLTEAIRTNKATT